MSFWNKPKQCTNRRWKILGRKQLPIMRKGGEIMCWLVKIFTITTTKPTEVSNEKGIRNHNGLMSRCFEFTADTMRGDNSIYKYKNESTNRNNTRIW